jgi:DNA-binding MarR family transcriptional regulator
MRQSPPLVRSAIALRDLRRIRSPFYTEIPQGQVDTLDVIAQLGPCTMVQLSAGMRVDASTATRAVDRLVDSGLAARRKSEDDGRVVVVDLTDEGRSLDRDLSRQRLEQFDEMLDFLEAEEREQLADSLERLVGAYDHWWATHPGEAAGREPPTAPR